jgi:hypothetical protein
VNASFVRLAIVVDVVVDPVVLVVLGVVPVVLVVLAVVPVLAVVLVVVLVVPGMVVVVGPGQTQPGWHCSIAPPGELGGQLRLPGGSHSSPGSRNPLPQLDTIVELVVVETGVLVVELVVVDPCDGHAPVRGRHVRKRKSLSVFGLPLAVARARSFTCPAMSPP